MNIAGRVAVYLPSLNGGGAERVFVRLANAFADDGYDVDMVLAKAEGPYLAHLSEKVRVVDLRASRVLFSLGRLVQYLRRERPRVVLSALNHANVVAILAHQLSRSRARIVVSERAVISSYQGPSGARLDRVTILMSRWLYPRAAAVVAVSQGVAVDLIRNVGIPADRIRVINNPVDIEEIDKHLEAVPERIRTCDPFPLIVAAGRLSWEKDFGTLIHAFSRVRASRSAKLLILGEGGERARLEQLVRDLGLTADVEMPGFRSPFADMRRAAAFVLTSLHEGFPNVLLEAMACGTPIVSTACPGGVAEILEGGRWGRMVTVGDVDECAQAIMAALDDPNPPDVRLRAEQFDLASAVAAFQEVLGLPEVGGRRPSI